jgi:hypothetical protein
MRSFKVLCVTVVLSTMAWADAGAQTTAFVQPSRAARGGQAFTGVPQSTTSVRRRHRRRRPRRNMGMVPNARMRSLQRVQPF